MEELTRFIALAQTERFTLTELCEQFGISRKTAYKHLERYALGGFKALEPRSSRPLHSPASTDEAVAALILAERRLHRTWGPKKLRVVLETKHGITSPPACSTIAELLRRHGLSVRRRRRPGVYQTDARGCTEATQPNHVWTVDFKGWFLLGDGQRCDPLTVRDHHSHYVLCADALANQQYKATLRVFKGLMRHVGLPEIIHCDLGSPFASCGLGRLSSLSAWWVEQGIEVEFSRPGSPQDNGSHERMHRDLKAECTKPPSVNLSAQQRRMERWRHEFNHERPHEALGQRTRITCHLGLRFIPMAVAMEASCVADLRDTIDHLRGGMGDYLGAWSGRIVWLFWRSRFDQHHMDIISCNHVIRLNLAAGG